MFEKNLQFINNDGLKGRLRIMSLEQSSKDMSYCMTPSNDYLLMKNDVPLDDMENPREAIRQMLKATIKQPMGSNDIIITFGIGLCYLLDEVFNTYPSKIFIYEPDLSILHFVLNNVDISEHLQSGRVYITDDINELTGKLSSTYITKDKVEVVFLKNYAVVKNQELLELTQKVYEACRGKIVDINTIAKFSKKWLFNTLKNLCRIKNGKISNIFDLENKFIGQTALILAPGPSLNENIQYIKENRQKYVIFAVNKVLRFLQANDITPDFAVALDASYVSNTLSGLEDFCSQINCIADLKSDYEILDKTFKKVFLTFSENDAIAKELASFNKHIKLYELGSSATTMAFVVAEKFGFSKIVYAGLDMAFKDDVMYSTGETINRLVNNQIGIGSATKNIVHVPSVTGSMVATRDDYATAISHFEALLQAVDYNEVYNTTSFGANIKGMKNQPLDTIIVFGNSATLPIIINDVQPLQVEVGEWGQHELMLINNIITLLSNGGFSSGLVSAIVKSPLIYTHMQVDVINVLQTHFAEENAESFINATKLAIKEVIDLLQKNTLI